MAASALMMLAFYALVIEVMIVILLIIPVISPAMWSRLLSSNLIKSLQHRARVPFYVSIAVMGVIFYDAARIERESRAAKDLATPTSDHHNIEHLNARLFRAQRDLYIAGFGLFFVFVIYRLVKLVSEIARLDASCTAALRQAESANRAAQQLVSGSAPSGRGESGGAANKGELEKKDKEIERLRTDLEAMKRQAESLHKEYDRLCEEHGKALKKSGGSLDKKSD